MASLHDTPWGAATCGADRTPPRSGAPGGRTSARARGPARPLAAALAVTASLVAAVAGCAGPGGAGGSEGGPAADPLRARVRAASLPPLLLSSVGPPELASGGAQAVLHLEVIDGGRQVARFKLTEPYFGTAFALVDELRALGIQAAAHPRIWAVRHEAARRDVRDLADADVDINLTHLGAQRDVPAIFELNSDQKRALLASRMVLVAAHTGLPNALKVQQPSGRALRDRYFTTEDAPARPLVLEVSLLEAEVRAVGVRVEGEQGGEAGDGGATTAAPVGHQEAELRLAVRLLHIGPAAGPTRQRVLLDDEIEASATIDGSGVTLRGATYAVEVGPDDALARCFRQAAREIAEAAVEGLSPADR